MKANWSAFEAARGPDGRVRSHVWDRVCVPGDDEKDGQSTSFNLDTLSQMVDNFVERGDMVPLDANHQSNYSHVNGQPAPALAFYGALAVVAGGEIAKMGQVPGGGATGAEDGMDLSLDGLWAYRCEVTEVGDKLIPNFKYLSPTFMSDGTDREGEDIGYCLAAVAATNTPWQGGTVLTFQDDRLVGKDASEHVTMRVEQRGSKWVVLPESGDKVLGTHSTKADADKQLAAIEASKYRQEMAASGQVVTCPVCGERVSVTQGTQPSVSVHKNSKTGAKCAGSLRNAIDMQSAGKLPADNRGAEKMAQSKFAKFAGAADGADDAAIKQALAAKMAGLAKAAMEDEAFKYDNEAKELEDAAADMEDDMPSMEEEYESMKKMAATFRKMAKFEDNAADSHGAKEEHASASKAKEDSEGQKLEGDADDKMKMEEEMDDDEGDKDGKMAAMSAAVQGLKSRLAKFERAEADRAKAEGKVLEAKFARLADEAVAGGYPKANRGSLIKFARHDFEAARSTVESFLPNGGAPAHLFDRVTRQGGPIGGDTDSRGEHGPAKPRKIKSAFGTFVETDGTFADAIRGLAESKDPRQMAQVDKLLPEKQRPIMFNRLLAAQKIVRAEQPDLADSAEE